LLNASMEMYCRSLSILYPPIEDMLKIQSNTN